MYRPAPLVTGQLAIWVPIGQYGWYWNGTAVGTPPSTFAKSGAGAYGAQSGFPIQAPSCPDMVSDIAERC
jgi:hypothetical protein